MIRFMGECIVFSPLMLLYHDASLDGVENINLFQITSL